MRHSLKTVSVAALLCIAMSASAAADPCSDLVSKAQLGLQQQGLDESSKNQLEELLGVGRAGDISACQSAATGSLMSPMPASGSRCSKSDKTV
jgi:hypothetical protein